MAKPITPEQWLAALRAEGVTDIVEMPGWRTNNRNNIKAFTDVHATMIHHTAGEGSGLPRLLFDGRDDLPGPLCHDYLDRTGRLYLVGNGRANHAGTVAANAYAAVHDEKSVHPYPDAAEPLDGNALSYGLECENSGAEGRAWPAKQYDVAVRVQAARCRFHGWSANSVWAHKEATRRKPVDPRLDMDDFRAAVAARLDHEPGWSPDEEDDMAVTDADAEKIARKVLTLDGVIVNPVEGSPNTHIALMTSARNVEIIARRTEAKVAALSEANTKLVDAVAQLAAGIGDLDPASIVAELKQAIESIDVHLNVDYPEA
jgi:hypothetical protein